MILSETFKDSHPALWTATSPILGMHGACATLMLSNMGEPGTVSPACPSARLRAIGWGMARPDPETAHGQVGHPVRTDSMGTVGFEVAEANRAAATR